MPVLSNCTGRKEPGKPGTRPPGGDSPIGGGCLSANREGTRPGSWFPVPPLPGGFVRKPGFSFHPLPPCFRFAPEPVSQRFPGVLVSGGRVLSCSVVNVRRGARYVAVCPGTPPRFPPGAGSGSCPANGTGGGNRGTPPARRMEPGAGCRGLPPGNSSIHRGQPRFFGDIVTLPLQPPCMSPLLPLFGGFCSAAKM